MCMECAGVTLIHGCSTTEAFLDLVAMVRVGLSKRSLQAADAACECQTFKRTVKKVLNLQHRG